MSGSEILAEIYKRYKLDNWRAHRQYYNSKAHRTLMEREVSRNSEEDSPVFLKLFGLTPKDLAIVLDISENPNDHAVFKELVQWRD